MVAKKQRTVVTGPATPAPAVASRMNSSQTMTKSQKLATAKAKLSQTTKPRTKTKKPRSLLDSLLIVALSAFVLYSYNFCSTSNVSEALENPLCRSLYRYKTHVVDPYILPPLQSAYQSVITHPTVDKQLQQIQPYVERARPHVKAAAHYSEKTYSRIILPTWNNRVVPVSNRAWRVAASQYEKNVYPHMKPYIIKVSTQFEPYTSQVHAYSDAVSSKANEYYIQAQPHIIKALEYSEVAAVHGKHYGRIALDYSNRVYVILRPYLIQLYQAVSAGTSTAYTHAKPIIVQGYDTYVGPHLLQIWEKVVELSGKRDPDAFNGTSSEVRSVSQETRASSIEETASVSSTAINDPTTTKKTAVAVAAHTPEVPEEPSVPSASATPSTEAVAASSVAASPSVAFSSEKETITASASSVVIQEEYHTQTAEDIASASSVVAERAPPSEVFSSLQEEMTAAASSASAADSEDDLDSFLSDLGLDDSDVAQQPLMTEPEVEVVPEQQAEAQVTGTNPENPHYTPTQYTPEQIIANKAKRDELEGRHSEWERKIAKLAEQQEKEARQFLGAVRDLSSTVVEGLCFSCPGDCLVC